MVFSTPTRRWGLCALASGLCLLSAAAVAQTAPLSITASPEIYKVIAENAKYRVISVIWAPGQKDAMHSHPDSAVYFLTDCALRYYLPNGTTRDGAPRAGFAAVQAPIESHAVENIGQSDCKLIMFEPK
jgi:quercetin dioxygenase-like cupin family protein